MPRPEGLPFGKDIPERKYNELGPGQRKNQIRDDVEAMFEDRDRGFRDIAELDVMHLYHGGVSALEISEEIERHTKRKHGIPVDGDS
jgi:hypothetical protein